ncbi:MAG: diguanylate cyclase [Terriglobales bacterium]
MTSYGGCPAMSANVFDSPDLYRCLLEDLPVGIFIVDQRHRVRFWNRGAEHLTGHLAHEAMGQDGTGHLLEPCDRKGRQLGGNHGPITATLANGCSQQFSAYFLHKNGHRVAVRVRTRPVLENPEAIAGVMVLFEEAFVFRDDSSGPPMYGCLDGLTGVPSHLLTRAVLNECVAGMERSHQGFGLIRIRVLGLDEFRAKHGIQSASPLLRTTAQTLRHSLDPEIFLGRWGEDEFILIQPSANRLITMQAAETVWNLVGKSEVSWWGDRFSVQAVVMYTVAQPGDVLDKLLNGLEPTHAAAAGRAVGA